jgi:hypothetical protein
MGDLERDTLPQFDQKKRVWGRGQRVAKISELLTLIERDEARARGFRLWAVGVETDEVFVQLLCVDHIVLPLFQLGCLEQFLRLVPAAGG